VVAVIPAIFIGGRHFWRWIMLLAHVKSSCGLVLLACTVLFATCMHNSEVQARHRGYFFAPFYAPWPNQYYRPAWRPRYYAPPRKRKAARSARATQSRKKQQAALLIPRTVPRLDRSVDCEKARDILSEFGFKDIKAEVCTGTTLGFSASRDGKPFSIRILAANGEFEQVRRLR
jgi:hypothetical protein